LPFAFRSTEWDDVIVDVREKTTTIEVRILCTPRLDSLGNTVGSHGCLQHLWLSKNLAFVQTIFGENSRAISALTQLLQTPHNNTFLTFPMVVTPALLRLDPIWDPVAL
jgi:hypothetical protein